LLNNHIQQHKALFDESKIVLFDEESHKSNETLLMDAYSGDDSLEMVQKLWAYGRYLFISATNKGGLPCPLYGLWCGDYHPIWSQHVTNENLEMIYWHTLMGGLSELMLSVVNLMDELMEDFKDNARKLFGCRGINIHGYISPGIGLASVLVPVITNWTGAAGWIGKFYYDYAIFTGDYLFLKEKALPFLREVALFYEDFLVLDENGYYKFYPSVSPENSPGNYVPESYDDLSHPLPTTINATMDVAIAKEVLKNLIEGSRLCDVEEAQLEKWKQMLSLMPPYQINKDGAISEWMHPDFEDNYNHRHIPHIYPVFPGTEIGKDQTTYFEAFKIAVEKRLEIGLSAQSGWSLVHLANIYARFGEGENALECLNLLSRSCVMNNFLIAANDWRGMGICIPFQRAPLQIDASMGFVSAVQEMLLFTRHDKLCILPACPAAWSKGRVERLRSHTCEVSFDWDFEKKEIHIKLLACRDTQFDLVLPEGYLFDQGTTEFISLILISDQVFEARAVGI
jgi:alpha-L-fucosidase 2